MNHGRRGRDKHAGADTASITPGRETVRARRSRWARRLAAMTALMLGAAACTSPEARRVRGGGPGADQGNRRAVVEFHRGAEPYFGTPCVVAGAPCNGPAAVFGTRLSLD